MTPARIVLKANTPLPLLLDSRAACVCVCACVCLTLSIFVCIVCCKVSLYLLTFIYSAHIYICVLRNSRIPRNTPSVCVCTYKQVDTTWRKKKYLDTD